MTSKDEHQHSRQEPGQRSASMMAAFSSAPHFLVVYVVFIVLSYK